MKLFTATILALILSTSVTQAAYFQSGTLSTGSAPPVPTALPGPGTFTGSQSVTLTSSSAESIHYTTDGSTPTCLTGTEYTGSISVTESLTIRAVACHSGLASSVGVFAYNITISAPPPPETSPPPPSSGGPVGGVPLAFTTPTPIPTPLVAGISTAKPSAFGLKEGDTVSAAGSNDPDVYIVNDWGFKRLFLNPAIFNFYGHLGGFLKVRKIEPATRDAFLTSGLFRNCETNDPKVYAVDVTGEDIGSLHWVNMTGDQAVAEDASFFNKVFCINNLEFSWYPKSSVAYTSLSQVPVYTRAVGY
ncbi:MAG: chitobiase/beta-hexosaminidase C-terminal domain-containing protein [Candidatus Yanofskybacteria bacterium]|nr:chitobiase/beta-hexosaminidase C-terminal domain-containing protein [Candidatus Yanofskybacteria bacterium]